MCATRRGCSAIGLSAIVARQGRALATMHSDAVLYLSAHDVESLHLGAQEIIDSIKRVLQSYAATRAVQAHKSNVQAPGGSYFQALPAILLDESISAVKWVSVTPGHGRSRSVNATILLTALSTGRLLAILDGAWITAFRTAAMSAIAARALAKRDSRTAGFIGCGVQASSHLHVLKAEFPSIETVTAYARSPESAVRLCGTARALGISAVAVNSPREAVEGQDIVVSTVPRAGLQAPFLDATWLAPGAFASLVDLGRSWNPDTLRSTEVVATDDREQSAALAAEGSLSLIGRFAYDLAELAEGVPSTLNGSARRLFIFGGMPICDAAVAARCYQRATALGTIGVRLPENDGHGYE